VPNTVATPQSVLTRPAFALLNSVEPQIPECGVLSFQHTFCPYRYACDLDFPPVHHAGPAAGAAAEASGGRHPGHSCAAGPGRVRQHAMPALPEAHSRKQGVQRPSIDGPSGSCKVRSSLPASSLFCPGPCREACPAAAAAPLTTVDAVRCSHLLVVCVSRGDPVVSLWQRWRPATDSVLLQATHCAGLSCVADGCGSQSCRLDAPHRTALAAPAEYRVLQGFQAGPIRCIVSAVYAALMIYSSSSGGTHSATLTFCL